MAGRAPDGGELTSPDATTALVARVGLVPGPVLGRGVEGTVVDVGGGLVAKVWDRRPVAEVRRLADFYARAGGGEAHSRHAVRRAGAGGRRPGGQRRAPARRRPALGRRDGTSPDLGTREVDAVLAVLAALRRVPGSPALRALPVLPGEPALPGAAPFERELADLVVRRVGPSLGVLARRVPDVDALLADVVSTLGSLAPAEPVLVHGDLIAANILLDRAGASAVLDFDFLTTVGDPAFDAAVTASCFDMYGPRAGDVERRLDDEIASAFGYDATRLATYRAAYALATATVFSPDGTDGHFEWAVAMLQRPDVVEALRR